jgi:hypothetical protein
MGETGVTVVLNRLINTRVGDPAGRWLLDVLVSLKLAKHASTLVKFYRQQPPPAQALLVGWLCELMGVTSGALFDLMAGVLHRLPPDPKLANAIRAKLGAAALEEEASKWAGRGHQGAQIVLQRMYNYPLSAFRRQ